MLSLTAPCKSPYPTRASVRPRVRRIFHCLFALPLAIAAASNAADAPHDGPFIVDYRNSPHAKLRPLPFDAVQWTDGFWADRFRQLQDVTLRESWRLLADSDAGHVLDNFRIAGKSAKGEFAGTNWQDEWLYKWIEAASCVWRVTKDPWLEERMDEAIALIAAAQQPDGYLSTNIIASGKKRFERPGNHEVYNMGHLITTGVIHHRMTGKNTLLDVSTKTADFLCANLGVTVEPYFAENPSAIMGLIELYRLTGKRKYLDCAQLIVDSRGSKPRKQSLSDMLPGHDGTDQQQDRVPIRKSSEVVGHNVFSTYLYTGASDLQAEIGDAKLDAALHRLWDDLVKRKMFIHGGISALAQGLSNNAPVVEATGPAYDLPNASSYNETCGQIGFFMWGYRMLNNDPNARFADLMEREMYNGFLACIGLEGKSWFYRNILRRYDEDYQPQKGWTDMALRGQPGRKQICCPSNLLRTFAELSSYFYGTDGKGLWIHQYGGNRVKFELASGETFSAEQITDYPWSGKVKIAIHEAPGHPVPIHLRVPGWSGKFEILQNGKPVPDVSVDAGYATVAKQWKKGDSIELVLPMAPQLIQGNPNIEQTRNQVAVTRGPVVYCLESSDLPPDVALPGVAVPSDIRFETEPGLPGVIGPLAKDILRLRGKGLYDASQTNTELLYRPLSNKPLESVEVTLIPYFAWANRGRSAMSVWLPVVFR